MLLQLFCVLLTDWLLLMVVVLILLLVVVLALLWAYFLFGLERYCLAVVFGVWV